MPSYMIDGQILSDIADAIRSKTGSSAPIAGEDMASKIANIPTGGGGTPFFKSSNREIKSFAEITSIT